MENTLKCMRIFEGHHQYAPVILLNKKMSHNPTRDINSIFLKETLQRILNHKLTKELPN